MVNHPNRNKPPAGGAALKWKRVTTPDGTEHHMFAGDRHVATVFNEGDSSDPCWTVRDIVKGTEESGYEALADAKDATECLADE